MTHPVVRIRMGPGLRLGRPRRKTLVRRLALGAMLAALLYLAWPYLALWDLSLAVANPDPEVLAAHVDLAAIRGELRKKLNKDAHSAIGPLSDAFIQWLDRGIQRLGTQALDELVSLDWVRDQLATGSPPGHGFVGRVAYAFFVAPGVFEVRLAAPAKNPVHFRMALQAFRWRITAVYY